MSNFEEAYEFVRKRFEEEKRSISHDFTHITRVLNFAEKIAAKEGGDIEVIRFAALFHDIVRPEHDINKNHHELSAKEAEKILINYVPKEKIPHIVSCIETHSRKSKKKPETIEAKIIYDADKLDFFGYPVLFRGGVHYGGYYNGTYNDMYAAIEKYLKLTEIVLQEGFYTKTAQEIVKEKANESIEICKKILAEK